jgi:hypothetical protein
MHIAAASFMSNRLEIEEVLLIINDIYFMDFDDYYYCILKAAAAAVLSQCEASH